MFWWKRNKGSSINWYNHKTYKGNKTRPKDIGLIFSSFSEWWEDHWQYTVKPWYITTEDFKIEEYANNFTKTLPENPTFYFDKSSKFPRAKLNLHSYKRCIKKEKANIIVLGQSAEVKCLNDIYYFFTDGIDIFSIPDKWFNLDFQYNLDSIKNSDYIGTVFKGPLKLIYTGKIKLVYDPTDTLLQFNKGEYNKPFILDTDLDNILNEILPDPTLNDIKVIDEMLHSSDSNTIKLGSIMAAGFNINKWPLTFICLLGRTNEWIKAENGGNVTVVKQMCNTLQLNPGLSIRSVAFHVQAAKQTYSNEDIALAQTFVRTLPELKTFCERFQHFYIDDLPFIPNEYKK